MNIATIFDRQYPKDMQAEGIAISEAVCLGKCNVCPMLAKCSTTRDFKMPADTYCMKRKAEILKGWAKNGK